MDHANAETAGIILDKGYVAGLTVQLGKLGVEEVPTLVEKHGVERFVLDSDTGFVPSDTTTVTKATKLISEELLGEKEAEK